jgi:hypothetical protein
MTTTEDRHAELIELAHKLLDQDGPITAEVLLRPYAD